ncbi:hypothetical protein ACFWIW_10825 [Amycolatopsis sp. NPDC058340]|uniref:hypothetical protein n=1 Tax=Amycolatopsis sp. NPDC058340 TaxID=3346453 RepID=UPI0036676F63
MPVSESAAQLKALGADMPLQEQQAVTTRLEQYGAQVSEHLGSGHLGAGRIQEAINKAMSLSSDVFAALENITQVTNEVADSAMRG